jgi:hypothetical protein
MGAHLRISFAAAGQPCRRSRDGGADSPGKHIGRVVHPSTSRDRAIAGTSTSGSGDRVARHSSIAAAVVEVACAEES